MVINKEYQSIKRFGSRYGRRLKTIVGKIEALKRNSKNCPYCKQNKACRVAVGIWKCNKCNSKFTGKAYFIGKPKNFLKEVI